MLRRLIPGLLLTTAVAASLLLPACSAPTPGVDSTSASTSNGASFDENAARTEILASDSSFIQGLLSKHVDSALIHFHPDVVWLADGSTITKGKSEVSADFEKGVANLRDATYRSQSINFSPDHSVAWDYGTYSQTLVGPDGKTKKAKGNFMNVWRNVDGRWMVVAAIGTGD